MNRNKYILTNILKCSHCGGNYTMYGKNHLRCKNHKRGTSLCTNSQSVKRVNVEERVLATLKFKLLTPELIKTFTDEYTKEYQRQQKSITNLRDNIQTQLDKAIILKDNLITAIETGSVSLEILAPKLNEREEEIRTLQNQLEDLQSNHNYLSIDTDLGLHFANIVRDLQSNLECEPIRREAVELIQSMMSKVVVIPTEGAEDGVTLEVYGDLAQILSLSKQTQDAHDPERKKLPANILAESQLSVVAGARFELTTFRL